jgi:hypothetical protein
MDLSFRLPMLLGELMKRHGGAASLARLIEKANLAQGRIVSIDPRTLQGLVEEPLRARLSVEFLLALDVFLTPMGEGLADRPLFAKPDLLECLVDRGQLTFLLGSRALPDRQRIDLIRWDVWAMADLLGQACRTARGVQFAIEDVLWLEPARLSQLPTQRWHQLLDESGRSFVSLGTTKGCLASEIMLASMLQAVPFEPPSDACLRSARVPYFYVWPGDRRESVPSAFVLSPAQLAGLNPAVAAEVEQGRAGAFVFLAKSGSSSADRWQVQRIPVDGPTWEMYGAIVAQRRANGSVWLVVSG